MEGARSDLLSKPPFLWVLFNAKRIRLSILAGCLAAVATYALPAELRAILSYDAAASTYLALFTYLMFVATPAQAAELSRRQEPSGVLVVISTIIFSVISIILIVVLMNNLANVSFWMKGLHIGASLFALMASWLLAHVLFGLQYMRLYYNDELNQLEPNDDVALDFPARPQPDFWDFMYYSFTIAMCYQTSDVTINNIATRRLTLGHAIFSFFYVATIVGLVVNILSNLI